MKFYITLFFTILFSQLAAIQADPSLQKAVSNILSFPEGAAFIRNVEKQGQIRVVHVPFGKEKVGAMWEADTRTIYVSKELRTKTADQISSIIFELHNASSSDELELYYRQAETGQISKEEFVESIERMEHRNALAAQNLINRGISMRYFPEACRMFYFEDFNDYYALQQLFDHSQWIGRKFDAISPRAYEPYRGTIADLPLHSRQNRRLFLDYLANKNEWDAHQRRIWLMETYPSANSDEVALLNFVFDTEIRTLPRLMKI